MLIDRDANTAVATDALLDALSKMPVERIDQLLGEIEKMPDHEVVQQRVVAERIRQGGRPA